MVDRENRTSRLVAAAVVRSFATLAFAAVTAVSVLRHSWWITALSAVLLIINAIWLAAHVRRLR